MELTEQERRDGFAVHREGFSLGSRIIHGTLDRDTTRLFLDGHLIASFDNQYEVFSGEGLTVDLAFWMPVRKGRERREGSQAVNLWKRFLQIENDNWALLIRRLRYGQTSSLHMHANPEYLFQLGGSSHVLSSLPDFSDYRIFDLNSSEGLLLPANRYHVLIGGIDDSLTIPIKKTNKKRSDHVYPEKTPNKIWEIIETITEGYS